MMLLAAALAAPHDGPEQDEQLTPSVVDAEHSRMSLGQINNLYRNGRPSNDVHLAGLFVHQHDNTEVRTPTKGHPRPLPERQNSTVRRVGADGGGRRQREEGAPTTMQKHTPHRKSGQS